jgi:glutamate racemase
VGGLTVAVEVFFQLPRESILYFGDTAHVPYGGRSREELISFADAISAFLVANGAKLIIDACNSTSSVALDYLAAKYPVPFVGVVEPGVRAALRLTRNRRIGVIATEATASSGSHRQVAARLCSEAEVFVQACPLLVPLAEQGAVDTPEARAALEEYLEPLKKEGIDTLILGCTHYPFFRPLIASILGPEVALVDPAAEAVRDAAQLLAEKDLLAPEDHTPRHRYFASGDPEAFRRNAENLLGRPLPPVERVVLAGEDVTSLSRFGGRPWISGS